MKVHRSSYNLSRKGTNVINRSTLLLGVRGSGKLTTARWLSGPVSRVVSLGPLANVFLVPVHECRKRPFQVPHHVFVQGWVFQST